MVVSLSFFSSCFSWIRTVCFFCILFRPPRRIKDNLQGQVDHLQTEQKAYDKQLEEVERRIALCEVDLAKLKSERKKPTPGKQEPLSELHRNNSQKQQSGGRWRQEELSAVPVVGIARHSLLNPR